PVYLHGGSRDKEPGSIARVRSGAGTSDWRPGGGVLPTPAGHGGRTCRMGSRSRPVHADERNRTVATASVTAARAGTASGPTERAPSAGAFLGGRDGARAHEGPLPLARPAAN